MATVVILGGRVGGLVASNPLRRRLDRRHRIVLVDRLAQHVYTPSFLWMMLGWREPREITRDLARLERKGIEVVQEEIREIDPARRLVRTERRQISGDYLIVALGAEARADAVPGLAEGGHNLYDLDGVLGLRQALASLKEGRGAVTVASPPLHSPPPPPRGTARGPAGTRPRRPGRRG